jgi:hypothetical protein
VVHVGAVGQELLAQLAEYLVRCRGRPRQGLGEELREVVRLDVGKEGLALDLLEVLTDQIHHAMARVAELLNVHRTHLHLAVILCDYAGLKRVPVRSVQSVP